VVSEFEATVARALDSLPDDLAAKLENVAIVVDDAPPPGMNVFGLFESAPPMPKKITIFREPLEREFGGDLVELERQIRITVLHELAHYFGLDEQRLAELGYA
jgi:predicted Zn-dependent protease with MMP-like domain